MLANASRELHIRCVIFHKVEHQIFRNLRFARVVLAVAYRCSRTLRWLIRHASAETGMHVANSVMRRN